VFIKDDDGIVKVFKGYNKKELARHLGITQGEANILSLWYHGDDHDLIMGQTPGDQS